MFLLVLAAVVNSDCLLRRGNELEQILVFILVFKKANVCTKTVVCGTVSRQPQYSCLFANRRLLKSLDKLAVWFGKGLFPGCASNRSSARALGSHALAWPSRCATATLTLQLQVHTALQILACVCVCQEFTYVVAKAALAAAGEQS